MMEETVEKTIQALTKLGEILARQVPGLVEAAQERTIGLGISRLVFSALPFIAFALALYMGTRKEGKYFEEEEPTVKLVLVVLSVIGTVFSGIVFFGNAYSGFDLIWGARWHAIRGVVDLAFGK